MAKTKAKKPKHTKIFCVVCKKWIKCHDEREFRNQGHYIDAEQGKHLLAPDIGKSTRRHSAAVRKDEARHIMLAEQAKRQAERAQALEEMKGEKA